MRKVLLFDGAKGTELLPFCKKGQLPAELNLGSPEKVRDLHESYLDAGSEVILTNTVGIDQIWMTGHINYAKDIISAGGYIAMEAVKARNLKSGIRRRVGLLISAPSAKPELLQDGYYRERLRECYQYQLSQALFLNKPLIVFETITSIVRLKFILEVFNDPKRLKTINKTIFSFCPASSGLLFDGKPIPELSKLIADYSPGIHFVGINCGTSVEESEKGISGHVSYLSPSDIFGEENPEEWAKKVFEVISRHNIRMVGGCCNTTPEHIRILNGLLG